MIVDSRTNGGWPDKKYNYFSWALSCLQLRKYYDSVELVTDKIGQEILIEKLELPYTSVMVELDNLSKYPAHIWNLGKVYAYSIQEEPFLHVDSDVFIWGRFRSELSSAGLVAQNIEAETSYYSGILEKVCEHFVYIPECFKELTNAGDWITAINAGVLGGNNIKFFKTYTSEIFNFINKNIHCIKTTNIGLFNAFYEQVFFYQLSKKLSLKINFVFPDVNDNPEHVGFLHNAPHRTKYVHSFGEYKASALVYSLLESKLKSLYPEYYYRIINELSVLEL